MSDEGTFESSAEPSDELRLTFWSLVVILDVAMLAAALGVLLIVFEARLVLGGASLAIGLLGFAVTVWRVRARRNT